MWAPGNDFFRAASFLGKDFFAGAPCEPALVFSGFPLISFISVSFVRVVRLCVACLFFSQRDPELNNLMQMSTFTGQGFPARWGPRCSGGLLPPKTGMRERSLICFLT